MVNAVKSSIIQEIHEQINIVKDMLGEQSNDSETITFTNVNKSKNRIVFGAPGTGKSYRLNKDIIDYNLGKRFERITFHPNYTFSQFVGSYKPISKIIKDGEIEKEIISYEFVPGPFLRVLVSALKAEKQGVPYLLVIEEINRANPASVFGDVFQLLDRNSGGKSSYTINMSEEMKKYVCNELKYEINELYIPNNMYIWATMNSADQGVYPMDSAFKRRWSFEYIGIDENQEQLKGKPYEYIELKNDKGTYNKYEWNTVRITINNKLKPYVNEDKLLGPFFLSENELSESREGFDNIFKSKVLMYLYEDILKHKKIDFFVSEVKTLSDIIKAYDNGRIFNFDIKEISEVDADLNEKESLEN
ncbi:restriction endonuclease [Bacillus anthracis]|nr:restriction endonuclease [Bacillus anthracis]